MDIVLTDIAMPGLNGLQLAAELQQLKPELPVLLVTGFAERADVVASGVPFLSKPFDQAALGHAIDAGISSRTGYPVDASLEAS